MRFKLTGFLLLTIVLMAGAGYWYYNDSQERIQTLSENNAKLETAIQISEETIGALEDDFAKVNETLSVLYEDFDRIRAQNDILATKLRDHDIGYLGSAKPGLVERIINRATDNVNRCFELLSGAELTEDERNAKTANAFNSECPWLWPGND